MFDSMVLNSFVLLAQKEGEAGGSPWEFLLGGPWLPFIVIGVLFYFMLIQPERRKRAEMASLLDNLKKNDRVVTIGGIIGVIVNVEKGTEEVVIRVDENNNTRLNVLRSSISRVLSDEKAAGS